MWNQGDIKPTKKFILQTNKCWTCMMSRSFGNCPQVQYSGNIIDLWRQQQRNQCLTICNDHFQKWKYFGKGLKCQQKWHLDALSMFMEALQIFTNHILLCLAYWKDIWRKCFNRFLVRWYAIKSGWKEYLLITKYNFKE